MASPIRRDPTSSQGHEWLGPSPASEFDRYLNYSQHLHSKNGESPTEVRGHSVTGTWVMEIRTQLRSESFKEQLGFEETVCSSGSEGGRFVGLQ